MKRRWKILLIVVPLVAIVGAWRIYRHVIPSSTDFWPYWSWLDPIQKGPRLISLDGSQVVQVMFSDGGAAQSGNFWTWLIVDEWLTGKCVIAEGYSDTSVRQGDVPFPCRWLDSQTLSVGFSQGRYDSTPLEEVVLRTD